MASRSHKILAMIQHEMYSSRPRNQNSPQERKDVHQPGSPLIQYLSDASTSGTNSIPDSQIGMDLSLFDDTDETIVSKRPKKKPNIMIKESSSSSTSELSSSSHSDSSESTSTDSSKEDFCSDDSVEDPDFQITHAIVSDSDDERDSSPILKAPEKKRLKILKKRQQKRPHARTSNLVNTDKQDNDRDMEPRNMGSKLDTTQPASNVLQPSTVNSQPRSIDTQQPSVDTQPPSVDTQPPSVDAQSPCVDTISKYRSRKRKANPELWKKNMTKFLRNSGKAYTSLAKSKKAIEEKKVGPACTDKCQLKCSTRFSPEDRLLIFEEYWKTADLYTQRQFVHEHMTKITPKYRYVRAESNRKNLNNAYYLTRNGTRERVCKYFFMHTLAISDKTIRTVEKKHSSLIGIQTKDNRGTHSSHNKTESHLIDGVKAHINSIPRMESHYCRAQSKREYIEGGTNIANLHRDYVEKCKTDGVQYVSYQMYYNIFVKDFNISFWQPKKDQCDDCTAYANAEDKASIQKDYDLHLKEKSLARAEKEKDKENVSDTFVVAVYDLQAVMPCPRGEVSSFYYISKLNLLDFTITELGTKNTTCFVWHEGEGARGVNKLGSCVLMYLKCLHDKATEAFDVVFYSDNCCGQQKNKFMLAMYQHAIRQFPNLRSITHKFLIKGHTQNEGDSVHSVIGRNISRALKSSPIYVPDQYITLIKTAKKTGKPYKVEELTHEGFFDLKPLAAGNYTTTEDGVKLKWSDIKVLKVDKQNADKFFFKTSYEDENFSSVSTLPKRKSKTNTVTTTTLQKLYAQKLNVPESKTRGILKLIEKNVIPKYYKSFYSNL